MVGATSAVRGQGMAAILSILVVNSAIWCWMELMAVEKMAKLPSIEVVSLLIRILRPTTCVAMADTSGVAPSALMVLALERFCLGGLFGGMGIWKMGVHPVVEGVGVEALSELLEARGQAGQSGEWRRIRGTILLFSVVWLAWNRLSFQSDADVHELSSANFVWNMVQTEAWSISGYGRFVCLSIVC